MMDESKIRNLLVLIMILFPVILIKLESLIYFYIRKQMEMNQAIDIIQKLMQ